MRNFSQRWLDLCELYSNPDDPTPFDDIGLQQFITLDTTGIPPASPTAFYKSLVQGKSSFNYLRTTIKDEVLLRKESIYWQGLYGHWIEWAGCRRLLRDLLDWFPKRLPNSYFEEREEFPDSDVYNSLSKAS